jgi:hypothetical protein
MKFREFQCLVLLLGASTLLSACRHREQQYEIEARTINGILRLLDDYSFEFPDTRVTNLAQIFAASGQDYPHGWHRGLIKFGKHAGFTNSFYEKYVFFPPGMTNRWMEGELLLMNAQCYPGPGADLLRDVLSRSGNRYSHRTLAETAIQRFLKESGIAEPKPVPMAPPPSEPLVDETSRKAAEALLEESYRLHPVPIWRRPAWQAAGVGLVLCAVLYGFFRLVRRP